MIGRSTQSIVEIVGIAGIAEITKNRQLQSTTWKEKRLFHRLADAEKWCEIHRTTGHDVEEYKTFLDHKKMPPPAPVAQEPCRGEHHRVNPDNEDQMAEINVIFRGSMFIVSKT
jgi:hypothetical protein